MRTSLIANERYVYIASLMKICYKKKNAKTLSSSDKIDRIVPNRWAALPIFAAVMFLVYYTSVTTVGAWATDWTNDGLFGDGFHLLGIGALDYEDGNASEYGIWIPGIPVLAESLLDALNCAGWLKGLVLDGIVSGVGAVLGFVPQMLVLCSMRERGWSFIKKAGTVILLSSIAIWAGSSFGMMDGRFCFSTDMELETSVLGYIGNGIRWIFAPLGFDSIKAAIATIMGLVAKEEVVGVFGVLDFEGMARLSAYSFLLFNLLCAPCFAAIGAIRREMNSAKWTLFAIMYQCVFAYCVSLVVYQLGMLFTGTENVVGVTAAAAIIAFAGYMLGSMPCK